MAKNKGSLLAKIKFMIGEQRNILSNDLFNQEVEHLKGRIEQVECTRTHEDTVRTSLKLLSELEKDMNALMGAPGGSHPNSSCSQDVQDLMESLSFEDLSKGKNSDKLGSEEDFSFAARRLHCNGIGTVKHFSIEAVRTLSSNSQSASRYPHPAKDPLLSSAS